MFLDRAVGFIPFGLDQVGYFDGALENSDAGIGDVIECADTSQGNLASLDDFLTDTAAGRIGRVIGSGGSVGIDGHAGQLYQYLRSRLGFGRALAGQQRKSLDWL